MRSQPSVREVEQERQPPLVWPLELAQQELVQAQESAQQQVR
ncbi:MAG: hypothetical protein ABI072_06365 [Edaphobacter sp.]